MKLSKSGFDFLKGHEGYRDQVYDDATGRVVSSYSDVQGYPTIGIGHLITASQRDYYSQYLGGRKNLTESQVYKLFLQDVPKYYKFMEKLKVPITQSMFDSLTSLSFNTGNASSTVRKAIAKINAGDYVGAASQIQFGINTSKGRVLDGLTRRRLEESILFLKDGVNPKTVGGLILLGILSFGLYKWYTIK